MHVERYGHGGAPVLLVHGFGTCSFLWRDVGPVLASANRTAFAIDLFGYGESDRPFDAQFGIAAQSDYVDRALTALRLTKATIVGIDVGGAVAMHLAYNRPERVERLILVNPIAFDEVPADDIKTMQRNTARFALRISRGVLGAAPLLRELLDRSVADRKNMPDRARRAVSRAVRRAGRPESSARAGARRRRRRHGRGRARPVRLSHVDRLGRSGSVRESETRRSAGGYDTRQPVWCVSRAQAVSCRKKRRTRLPAWCSTSSARPGWWRVAIRPHARKPPASTKEGATVAHLGPAIAKGCA